MMRSLVRLIRLSYFDDHDAVSLQQERQRILHSATRFPDVFPCDRNPLWRQCGHGGRHDQDRTTSFQKKTTGVESAERITILPLVADDDQIGRPGFARQRLGW